MQPFTVEQLNAFRAQAKTVEGHIQLRHSAIALWPYVSSNDILDKKVGLPAVNYQFKPKTIGDSWIYGETIELGLFKAQYVELPYQWLPSRFSSVERVYKNGLFRYFMAQWQLADLPQGGCVITSQFRYVPRYSLLPLQRGVRKALMQILHTFTDIDMNLPNENRAHVLGFEGFFQDGPEITDKIKQLSDAWAYLMPNSPIPQKVAEFIHRAPDRYVSKLRAFEIADCFNLPRLPVLTFCLLATKQGFLDLNWYVLCPSCQGANLTISSLWDLNTQGHCEACNIRYDAHFDKNVEAGFRPRPGIRQLDYNFYCFASPGATRHVWAQFNLDPYQTQQIPLDLPLGDYRLYSPMVAGEVSLNVEESATQSQLEIELTERFTLEEAAIAPQTMLKLHNPDNLWKTVKIEQLDYRARVTTAALVTSLQDFRDLFSASQVLRPNMQLGISNIVILFSDLRDSTRLYEMKGDAAAFALVHEHFDVMIPIIRQQEGGIVKTIGDAIMAVFTNSKNALQAAIQILEAFAHRNQHCAEDEKIIIKLGLHKGACIVLNLNDKIDYFGSTVNCAARIQGTSIGNDLVISETLFCDEQVQKYLTQRSDLQRVPFKAELKGIQGEYTLYRFRLPGYNSPA